MDLQTIRELLPLLRTHGATRFKCSDFEVELGPDLEAEAKAQAKAVTEQREALKKQEESLPPDLRADDLMNQDKVLHWSSGGGPEDPAEQPLPLTGDTPIETPPAAVPA